MENCINILTGIYTVVVIILVLNIIRTSIITGDNIITEYNQYGAGVDWRGESIVMREVVEWGGNGNLPKGI